MNNFIPLNIFFFFLEYTNQLNVPHQDELHERERLIDRLIHFEMLMANLSIKMTFRVADNWKYLEKTFL